MKRAFTLVELMVCVSMCAIIAAIAIPNLLKSEPPRKVRVVFLSPAGVAVGEACTERDRVWADDTGVRIYQHGRVYQGWAGSYRIEDLAESPEK
jgi:prepilin-type N-terminal cleavage/methylation domain-containing protein